jgi:hypothetical protein
MLEDDRRVIEVRYVTKQMLKINTVRNNLSAHTRIFSLEVPYYPTLDVLQFNAFEHNIRYANDADTLT